MQRLRFHGRSWVIAAWVCAGMVQHVAATTTNVNSISGLQSAINSAVAGDEIVVANGLYTTSAPISVSRRGTALAPIIIRAETIGGVEITGSDGFDLNTGSSHIEVKGFVFTHDTNGAFIDAGATYCRFTRNVFENPGTGNYLQVAGDNAVIDYNEFRDKSTVGNMIDIRGSGSQVAQGLWIHHNYFHDFTDGGGNGSETIRYGLSGLSLSNGFGLVEDNLFVRCNGENEMISNKASSITYRYNTVLDSREISQRHGNDNLYYGNYIRNSDGFRVYGDRNVIYSNYMEGNNIGVTMGNGDGDVYAGDPLTSHDRPDDDVVAFNTFVENDIHYQRTGRTDGLGSTHIFFANNIIQGGGTAVSVDGPGIYSDPVWEGNILWNVGSVGDIPASGYTVENPLLTPDINGVYHLDIGSPAIDSAVGSYLDLLWDMDGQLRPAAMDIGADERSGDPIVARLLTTADVGPLSPILNGDLNFDGLLNSTDWVLFKAGQGMDFNGMTPAQSFLFGDLNGDLKHDLTDFSLFRTSYEETHGEGAFARMLAGVPEPSSWIWELIGVPLLMMGNRKALPRSHVSKLRRGAKFAGVQNRV
jgi:Chondroitinase B